MPPELVLQEGVRLSATTPSGTVSVTAGQGYARTYEWNGCSLAASMMARSQRWYGAMGLYDPAGAGPLGLLLGRVFGCNGISRTVVEEAQVHFATQSAAERWIAHRTRLPFETVWSNDGLLLAWGVSPGRQQLNVDLWQICIAGLRPAQLRGARDDMVQVTRVAGDGKLRQECASVGAEAMVGVR
ncbi:hypothetical protein [uncultured Ramlibacter sp.]|uniref:hypothetical protein n=1 Tax=uncultured Ramlibacter sp. TaxID=260755 RepID=UPI002625EF97|nr:hypothetical protein [uncultured Ramlibacter sp.]